jgi:AraC-like DNA-binding protein
MLYEEFAPLPGSSPWVASFWKFAVEAQDPASFEHVIVPDGTLSISLSRSLDGLLSPIVFAGPSTTAHRVMVRHGVSYIGVRLHPAATGPLLGIEAQSLAGQIGLLGMVAPTATRTMDTLVHSCGTNESDVIAALDSAIKALNVGSKPPDPAVVRAVDALLETHGVTSLAALAQAAGLSARQFRRKFLAHVGLSPKEFARIRRIRHACILMLQENAAQLAAVSHDGGYADQPHLSREFRGIFGSSPRLVEAYLRQIEHIAVKD